MALPRYVRRSLMARRPPLEPGVIERAFDLGVKLTYRRFALGTCDAYIAPHVESDDSRGIAHGVTRAYALQCCKYAAS